MNDQWNPYYIAYAKAHGTTPAEIAAVGEAVGLGFVLWMGERWRQWRALVGLPNDSALLPSHHEQFASWLASL